MCLQSQQQRWAREGSRRQSRDSGSLSGLGLSTSTGAGTSVGGLSLVDGLDEPLHALVETCLGDGRARLDVPSAIGDVRELEMFHDFIGIESKFQVLFVCENK